MKDTRSEEKRKHIDGRYLLLPVKLFMSFVHGPIKGHLQPHVYIFISTVFLFLCRQRHSCKLFSYIHGQKHSSGHKGCFSSWSVATRLTNTEHNWTNKISQLKDSMRNIAALGKGANGHFADVTLLSLHSSWMHWSRMGFIAIHSRYLKEIEMLSITSGHFSLQCAAFHHHPTNQYIKDYQKHHIQKQHIQSITEVWCFEEMCK